MRNPLVALFFMWSSEKSILLLPVSSVLQRQRARSIMKFWVTRLCRETFWWYEEWQKKFLDGIIKTYIEKLCWFFMPCGLKLLPLSLVRRKKTFFISRRKHHKKSHSCFWRWLKEIFQGNNNSQSHSRASRKVQNVKL